MPWTPVDVKPEGKPTKVSGSSPSWRAFPAVSSVP